MKSCHRCGRSWPAQDQPGFNNTCEGCGTPVHSCANCEHYRREGKLRCSEPQAPHILDGASANNCTLFRFRIRGLEPEAGEQIESVRKNFLEGDRASTPTGPQRSWDTLFRD